MAAQGVDFDADYSDAGKLVVESTSAAVNLNGAIVGSTVKFGDAATEETAQIRINGAMGNNVSGSVEATDTLTLADSVTVSGTSTKPASLKAVKTTVSGTASVDTQAYGTTSLGALTIAAGTASNSLTLTTAASGTTTADTLTLTKTDATNTASGSLTIDGTGSFKLLKGESSNNGSITLNNGATLTIAEEASFVNNETVKVGDTNNANLVVDGVFTNNKTLNVSGGAVTVAGTLTNTYAAASGNNAEVAATLSAASLTVEDGGVVRSDLTKPAASAGTPSTDKLYTVAETTLEEGSAFITTLNKRFAATGNNDALQINGISFVLQGGVLGTAADAPITSIELVIGAGLTVDAAYDTAYTRINVGADDSKLNVTKDGVLTVATLDASTAGEAAVTVDGTMTVTNTVKTGAAGQIKIKVGGTMSASLGALGYEINSNGAVAKKTDGVSSGMTVDNTGVLEITGLTGTLKAPDITTLKGIATANGIKGLIDLGDVALDGVSGSTIEYSKLSDYANIATTALKEATITKTDSITSTASFGKVVLNAKKPTQGASETNLGVAQDVVLTLNGTGNLVEYADGGLTGVKLASGSSLITTGTGAVLGSVVEDGTVDNTSLTVKAGSLTTNDINVDAVNVIGDLTIAQKESGSYVLTTGALNVEGTLNAAAADVSTTQGSVTGTA